MAIGRQITKDFIDATVVATASAMKSAMAYASNLVESGKLFPYDDLIQLYPATAYTLRNEAVRRAMIAPGGHSGGTAQGGTATTIQLATTALAADDAYSNALIKIVSGTGAGQIRRITSFVAATKTATIDTTGKQPIFDVDWATVPDNTSVYSIYTDCQDLVTYFLALENLVNNNNGLGVVAADTIADPAAITMISRHADLQL